MKSLEIWGDLCRELGAETGFRHTGLLYVTDSARTISRSGRRGPCAAREYQMHSRVLSACRGQGD